MSLRVLIADDEDLVRRSIRRFLRNHDVDSVTECIDGREALHAIQSGSPNLVFMDIQMPQMQGMDVISMIGAERMPPTIVVTAHANYAVEAFNFNVVDYLLKPFGRERFDKSISRALHRIESSGRLPADLLADRKCAEALPKSIAQQQEYAERIAVPRNGRIFLIETKEIQWIEAQGNMVSIHHCGQNYGLRRPLTSIQKQLNPKTFVRLHRSTLVNVRFIREIQPWFKGYHLVVLKNGQELRMSRYQQNGIQYLTGLPFVSNEDNRSFRFPST